MELRHLVFACPDLDFGNVCPACPKVQRFDLSVCGCAPLVPIHVHVTNDGFRTQLVYVFTLFYNLKIMGKPA